MYTPRYRDEVNKILARLEKEGNLDQEPKTAIPEAGAPEDVEDIYVLIIKENPDLEDAQVIDSVAEALDTTPLPTQPAPQPTPNGSTGIFVFGVFLILLCLMSIMFQFSLIMNPFTAHVALVARSQQVSLTGTLELGRVLTPITLSQSQTAQTTGKGHQDARSATGFITFYNGQLNSVFVPAGTSLTATDGVQIITNADANIPAADLTANPPVIGQVSVPAHAVNPGSRGNIQAYDINEPCCSSVVAKNLNSFIGGQDERNFQTVAPSDITNAASPLQATLDQSMQGALSGQLKSGEALVFPHCTPTTTSDHRPGEEATIVKVTVSETCSAVAVNQETLRAKVTQLLTTQARKQLGSGYSMLDTPQVTVTQARIHENKVVLSFNAQSTWIYALSSAEQNHIKKIIAGKNKQQAMQLLSTLPGIESVSMQSSGFGDDSRIPKDISHIHLLIFFTRGQVWGKDMQTGSGNKG